MEAAMIVLKLVFSFFFAAAPVSAYFEVRGKFGLKPALFASGLVLGWVSFLLYDLWK